MLLRLTSVVKSTALAECGAHVPVVTWQSCHVQVGFGLILQSVMAVPYVGCVVALGYVFKVGKEEINISWHGYVHILLEIVLFECDATVKFALPILF